MKELSEEELLNDLLCDLMIVDLELQKEEINLGIIENKLKESISNCKSIIGLISDTKVVGEVSKNR
ncbi:hypothetical protein [Orenia marismortui]|uniref:hypothetical protein n=1 Tax=Orenia marismortui TaxID=46469 RepID=UPI00036B0CA3|nr:hypothetical protein [Orenia marismortui]